MKTLSQFHSTENNLYNYFRTSNILRTLTLIFAFLNIYSVTSFAQSYQCDFDPPELEDQATLCDVYPNILQNINYILGTTITKASQITGDLTGNILIAGDFLVDRPFKFYDAVILVWPGYKIEVNYALSPYEEGYNNILNRRPILTIDNCDIFSCEYLWKGIEMNTKTDLIIKNGTHIEDAEKAVNAINTNGVTLNISNTLFNRNIHGVYLSNDTYHVYDPVFKRFSGNQFTCTSTINEYANKYSETGLYLKNINANIGAPSGGGQSITRFENQDYGIQIIGASSILRANYLNFDLCWNAGIYIEDSGSLDLEHAEFERIFHYGIYGKSLRNLSVGTSCVFHFEFFNFMHEPNSIGIFLEAFPNGGIVDIQESDFITDNNIPVSKNCKGIYIKGNQVGSNTTVNIYNENVFDFSGVGLQGIELDGNFPASFACNILDNSFNLHSTSFDSPYVTGLSIHGGNKYYINIIGNTFGAHDQSANSGPFGIRISGSHVSGTDISSNDFLGEVANLNTCIWASDYTNMKICDNTNYFSAFVAWSFQNKCFSTNFTHNTMIGGLTGVWLPASGAIMGEQFHKGNKFIPYYQVTPNFPTLIWHPFNQNIANPAASRFYINTPQSVLSQDMGYTYFSELFPASVDPNDGSWFQENYDDEPDENCGGQSPPNFVDTLDILIAIDDMGDFIIESARQWDAQQYLYYKLKSDATYASLRPIFSQFLEDNENTTLGLLYAVDQAIYKSVNRTLSNLSEIEELDNMIDDICKQRDSISAISSWSSTDAANLTELYDSLYILRDNLNSFDLYQLDTKSDLLDTASAILSQISSQSLSYKENSRLLKIYLIDILKHGYGGISSIESGDIIDRALQCPNEGGMAVYGLRGLIEICDLPDFEENFNECDSVITLSDIAPDTLIGNPPYFSKYNFEIPYVGNNLNYPIMEDTKDLINEQCVNKVEVFNFDGKIVYSTKNEFYLSNINRISSELKQFPTGLYLLCLYQCDGIIKTEKIFNP